MILLKLNFFGCDVNHRGGGEWLKKKFTQMFFLNGFRYSFIFIFFALFVDANPNLNLMWVVLGQLLYRIGDTTSGKGGGWGSQIIQPKFGF